MSAVILILALVVGVKWALSWVRRKVGPTLPPDHCPLCWPFDCGCHRLLVGIEFISASEDNTNTKPTADDVAAKES